MNIYIKRNNGVFEAEARLWSCHVAVLLNTCGYVLLGLAIQQQLHVSVLVIGWGIAQVGIMIGKFHLAQQQHSDLICFEIIGTVAVCESSDS